MAPTLPAVLGVRIGRAVPMASLLPPLIRLRYGEAPRAARTPDVEALL